MTHRLSIFTLLLCLLCPAAIVRTVPVTLAYDYYDDTMPAFSLYARRINGQWLMLTNNAGGTNRSFTVQLPPGAWAFYATAVDAYGQESDPSNECQWTSNPGFRTKTRTKAKE